LWNACGNPQERNGMSTGLIIVIVVVVVVVVALIGVTVAMPQIRSRRLQQQFGPEYERTVAQHDGDTKEAEHELSERVKRTRELDLHPLDPAQRERYLARWTALQEQFVDAPGKAVIDADHLLTEVLRERGYPDDDQDTALSVHHTRALDGYRVSRNAAERAGQGSATTEELRDAFVRARETFDQLVRDDGGQDGRTADRTEARDTAKDTSTDTTGTDTTTDTDTGDTTGTDAPAVPAGEPVNGTTERTN
jgi:hypothetical protein